MFNKNLEALKKINLKLANKIQAFPFEEATKSVSAYEAESKDYVISYKDVLLDSAYDPIREAKTIWNTSVKNELTSTDIVIVFGLGLGYLFKRAYVNCPAKIILTEPFLPVLRFVLEYVDFSEEFVSGRVLITDDYNEALDYINQKYLSNDKMEVLFPKAYYNIASNELIDFSTKLLELCQLKNMDSTTINFLSKIWTYNTIFNAKYMHKTRPLNLLENKYKGKTALITATGPSLKDNIETIKNNRNKFVIFSPNKSLEFLVNNGVTPDFTVFSDAQKSWATISNILEPFRKMNVIADTRAGALSLERSDAAILNYYSRNDAIGAYLAKKYPEIKLNETGGTSSIQAYFGAKLLGFDKIIFAGLDLAFKENEMYASGVKLSIAEDNKIISEIPNLNRFAAKVKGVTGEMVNTRDDYTLFVRQFEEIMTEKGDTEVYNISDFGAYIEGMTYSKLSDITANLPDSNVNINEDLANIYNATETKWKEITASALEFINNEAENAKNILEQVIEITPFHQELLETAEKLKTQPDAISEAKFNDDIIFHTQNLSNLLSEIANDPLLIQTFQIEFMNYSKLRQNNNIPNIDSFIKSKKFDLELLNNINEVTTNIINKANTLKELNLTGTK